MSTPPPLTGKTAEEIRQEIATSAITDLQARLRKIILTARTQVQGKQVQDLDRYLDNCNPATAVDGRLPWSPSRVVTVPSRFGVFTNMLGLAILAYGRMAEGEHNDAAAQVAELERIVNTDKLGLAAYRAVPVERNSAIHVLRTPTEQAKVETDRAERELKMHEQREAIRAAKFEKPEQPEIPEKDVTDDNDQPANA